MPNARQFSGFDWPRIDGHAGLRCPRIATVTRIAQSEALRSWLRRGIAAIDSQSFALRNPKWDEIRKEEIPAELLVDPLLQKC
jgi:hypothetical protein